MGVVKAFVTWRTAHPAAVFAIRGSLPLGAMVGFVTLFGTTLRNSIMMLYHYEHLMTTEGQKWDLNTAARGARERRTPIFMTALVTALALLPRALGSGETGREIEGQMGIIILDGLLTFTALNLFGLTDLSAPVWEIQLGSNQWII